MDCHLELKKNARGQQTTRIVEKILSPQASQSTKLRDRLKSEQPMSYADPHHEIMRNVDNVPPKTSGNYQERWRKGKATEDDELVKYMYDLPSYLEKGGNLQEKVLNVGVLDWGRLEKWQYDHKQVPYKSSRCSPSSSNTSPLFSTDGSSAYSSRGQSRSPAYQRMHRPTLESHLKAFPGEGYSQGVHSFGGNVGNFQDLKTAEINTSKGQQKFLSTDLSSCKSHSEVKLEQCKRKDVGSKTVPELEILPNVENLKVKSCSTGKMNIEDVELTKRLNESQKPNSNIIDKDCPERPETVVLILPRDPPRNSHSRVSQLPGSTMITIQRSTEASRRSFSDSSHSLDIKQGDLYSDIPHSCPLPREIDSSEHSQLKQHSSTEGQNIKFSSDASHSLKNTAKKTISPSSKKKGEKPNTMPTNSTVSKPSEGSDPKVASMLAEKVRNLSPARRFSIGLGRISRNASSKEGSAMPQLSSAHITAKSDSERDVASASLDNSSSDKPNATGKSRSSPLRRLLDPLVKPKAVNCRNIAEPLQKDLTSTERACKSSDGQLNSSTGQSAKVKLDLSGCGKIDVNNSCQYGKRKSSAIQALLRVAVKNGLPLFTLAVDNDSDILAATVRVLSTPGKDDYRWTYTFFTIREIKKKNGGWINQGGKGKRCGYIPNIVAQMKVSDSHFSNLTRPDAMDEFSVREFVLLAVDQRQADQQPSSVLANDELAAIVIKFPKETAGSLIKDGQKSGNYNNLTQVNSVENGQNRLFVGSENLLSTTVILPNGVHSLPSKGEPSSLIERWKSGGLCDCGGWDLGCKLRVLAKENQLLEKFGASSSCSATDQFDLFCQEEVLENQPVFSLAPFKDGIYSVEFNSSLSLLQAFSICIAVLDSRKLFALSQSNLFEENALGQTMLTETDGIKTSNRAQGEVPAKYVSYPPLSPVGRV